MLLYADGALTQPVVISGAFPQYTVMFYRLDTVLTITGNTITNAMSQAPADQLPPRRIAIVSAPFVDPINDPTYSQITYGEFNIINVSGNVICGEPVDYTIPANADKGHVVFFKPLAGKSVLMIGANVYTDCNNEYVQGNVSYSLQTSWLSSRGTRQLIQTTQNPAGPNVTP